MKSIKFNSNALFVAAGLLATLGLVGCSQETEEIIVVDAGGESDVPQMSALPVPEGEGSEPKGGESDEGLVPPEDDGIDRSISQAGEYGDDAFVAGLSPEGWARTGNIEHYNVATLYTKIDGRSELYMAYNVLGMSWVSFVSDSDKSDFIDLFIYDMRSPTNAFGIYSVEREADQPPADLGREAYRTRSNYYFWKGNFYGYINASRENDGNSKAGLGVATALMQRITDSGEAVRGLDLLPRENLILDTVQYFKADAMSLDFLTETFLGMYQLGENKVRAFVSMRASDEEAADILTQFGTYGDDYADGIEMVTIDGVEVILTDWGGDFYDVAFQVGPLVAGLTNVEGKDLTMEALGTLIGQLKE